MSRGSIFSELLRCGGGLHSILLLPIVARCLETKDVCICLFYVCCRDSVGVCGNGCCVVTIVKDSGVLALQC